MAMNSAQELGTLYWMNLKEMKILTISYAIVNVRKKPSVCMKEKSSKFTLY